jgi:hypothetical protein
MGRGAVTVVAGIFAVGTAAALGACGEGGGAGPAVKPVGGPASGTSDASVASDASAASGLVESDYDGRFQVAATVLEQPPRGPELCAGGVDASDPPQCSGPPIVGWDWDVVQHSERGGVRHGTYTLVGTWDGQTFTLAEPATAPRPPDVAPADDYAFTVPCEPRPGGFAVTDPALTGVEDFERAALALQGRPDVGYVAVRQSGDYPGATAEPTGVDGVVASRDWLLIVTTTGDLAETEAAARELWGGPLCVAAARRTGEELRAVQEAIIGGETGEGLEADFLYAGVEARTEQVTLGVLVATEELQARMDAEFGEGVVRLEGALQPID